jgi:hypothetical protein
MWDKFQICPTKIIGDGRSRIVGMLVRVLSHRKAEKSRGVKMGVPPLIRADAKAAHHQFDWSLPQTP